MFGDELDVGHGDRHEDGVDEPDVGHGDRDVDGVDDDVRDGPVGQAYEDE